MNHEPEGDDNGTGDGEDVEGGPQFLEDFALLVGKVTHFNC